MTNSPADSILDFEGWELVGCSRLEQGELAKYGPAGCTVFMVELVCRVDGEVAARADLYVPEQVAAELARNIDEQSQIRLDALWWAEQEAWEADEWDKAKVTQDGKVLDIATNEEEADARSSDQPTD